MIETWRWFGPEDPVPLSHIRQAGVEGIVTALHQYIPGQVWTVEDIQKRKDLIERAGLAWSVCESIPVPDAIKREGIAARAEISAWKDTLARLGRQGIETVCYNFMPVVDWTRTDLMFGLPGGGYALRYDHTDFAAYDIGILKRSDAVRDYSAEVIVAARARLGRMGEDDKIRLEQNIIAGLPGGAKTQTRQTIAKAIQSFAGLSEDGIRANLAAFLKEVVPVAQDVGVKLAIHPDDPPFSLFGLPRVVSTQADARAILAAVDAPENGLTFCTGSYGARADNTLPEMAREFADRINFAHLRMVRLEGGHSFHEAEHLHRLDELLEVIKHIRAGEEKTDQAIPMRPDHGHLIGTDIGRAANPGYSYIGRLKGLAELRGLIAASSQQKVA
ncbi:mannonate dehydratase [Roseibium sp.]|uniref:mannonate dehydratase n=1 Tax=Roseibium sp. TaxID=1936156 RepID=UPI003B526645